MHKTLEANKPNQTRAGMQTTTQDPVYSDSRHKMLRIKIDGDMVDLPHDVDFDTIENSTGETLRDARDMYDDLVQRLWSEQTGNGIVKLNIEDASLEVIALGSPKRQQPVRTELRHRLWLTRERR